MDMCEEKRCVDQEAMKNKSPACFISDLSRMSTRLNTSSSARFGSFSHHSFFSRHNPHPHRVRHISGLNGSPVCIVNDDWYSNSPLFPHPLIRSQVASSSKHTSLSLPYQLAYSRADSARQGAALISEAWREELKDLATKVSLPAANQINEDEVNKEEEPAQRKTQYSSATGRIIPPSSWRSKRHDSQTLKTRPGTYRPQASLTYQGTHSLGGQELRVLELLCQILQTDSLSTVKQWLLLAKDQEKELVLGMLQQAMANSPNLMQQPQFPITAQTEHPILSRRKRRMKSLCSASGIIEEKPIKEKPEWIGDAEVLRIQPDDNQSTDGSKSNRVHSH